MVLTASMYEDHESFASGNVSDSNAPGGGELEVNGNVQPPPYPPPPAASTVNRASFPPPPVRIIETSTADWRMMVVEDADGNGGSNNNANNQGGVIIEEEDYELVQGGTLILDGDETAGSGNGNNIPDSDASLTIPDTDELPSDPGTIDGGNNSSNDNTTPDGNWEHLESDDDDEDSGEALQNDRRARFHRNLRKGRNWYNRKVRPVVARLLTRKDGAAEEQQGETDSLTFSGFTAATPNFMKSTGFMLLMVACFLLTIPAYSYYSLVRSAFVAEERWIQLQQENQRLQQQEDDLRKELENLQEEAAAAMAKATSLSREHEKWKLLHGATSGDKKEFYFAGDGNEDCDKDSFSILDNCWVKAKAKVDLGDCGDASKDFLKNLWDNLWSSELWGAGDALYADWDYYVFAGGDDHDDYAMEPYSPCDEEGGEDCQNNDGDAFAEDPLSAVFNAIQSAGQSFGSKLSQLMHDEAANTQKAAAELEDAIHKGFSQASTAISQAMDATKKDMQALSQEVLTTLNAAVPRTEQTPPPPGPTQEKTDTEPEDPPKTQTVTRQGLFDAASALSSLSKTWHEAVESMVSAVVPSSEDEADK